MRIQLLIAALFLLSTGGVANGGDESLRRLLAGADVVVNGEFTSELIGESGEAGVVHYQGDFKIGQLLKGEPLGDRRDGGTLKVNAIRFEGEPADRLPYLKQGGKCILFLTLSDRQPKPSYITSDVWLGIQPANSALAAELARLAKESPPPAGVAGLSAEGRRRLQQARPIQTATELLARLKVDLPGHRPSEATVHAYCPPQPTQYDWLVTIPTRRGEGQPLLVAVTNDRKAWRLNPQSLERIGAAEVEAAPAEAVAKPAAPAELHGEWRLFVPAGFEHEVTLRSQPGNRYRLTPSNLAFRAVYEVQGDHLVSVPEKPEDGVFKWKITSPYLLTLVEQPAKLSSDYLGAVFVRPSIGAQIQLQREQANSVPGVPKTTLEELDAMVEAGNYHLVRKEKLGHQIESVGVVRSLGKGHPDWVFVDLPGKHWGAHLRNVRSDHELNPGDQVRFRGIIVAEGYSAFTIWTHWTGPPHPNGRKAMGLDFRDKKPFEFHPEVPASKLKVELTPAKTVIRKQKHLILPVTITNRSPHEIQATLAHEWHGGEWPPTAIYASVTPEGANARPLQGVYRWGEDGKETVATVLPPGKSAELQLRMDWKGTGSVPAMPLMEESGRYHVRFALVFEAAGQEQYVMTDTQLVELPEDTENRK